MGTSQTASASTDVWSSYRARAARASKRGASSAAYSTTSAPSTRRKKRRSPWPRTSWPTQTTCGRTRHNLIARSVARSACGARSPPRHALPPAQPLDCIAVRRLQGRDQPKRALAFRQQGGRDRVVDARGGRQRRKPAMPAISATRESMRGVATRKEGRARS